MKNTIQELGIRLAQANGKYVLISPQVTQDALNAASSPSTVNPFATKSDITTQTSSTINGLTVTGTASFAGGVTTDSITEKTAGKGITMAKTMIQQNALTALNSTGTITAAMINEGGITSTSAAGVTATLDTASNIATQIGAVNGTVVDFYVDNTAGANTVTVAVATGITAATPVVTGGATLTVSVANAIGIFRLVFSSATTAKLFRIG